MRSPKSSSPAASRGTALLISLAILLVITITGLSSFYNITLQNKLVRMVQDQRLFHSEAHNLFTQIFQQIAKDPSSEATQFKTILDSTFYEIQYTTEGRCIGPGNDLSQPYLCRSVQVTVALKNEDGSMNEKHPQQSFTMQYQYRDFSSD